MGCRRQNARKMLGKKNEKVSLSFKTPVFIGVSRGDTYLESVTYRIVKWRRRHLNCSQIIINEEIRGQLHDNYMLKEIRGQLHDNYMLKEKKVIV